MPLMWAPNGRMCRLNWEKKGGFHQGKDAGRGASWLKGSMGEDGEGDKDVWGTHQNLSQLVLHWGDHFLRSGGTLK